MPGLSTDQCSNQAEVQKIRSGFLGGKKFTDLKLPRVVSTEALDLQAVPAPTPISAPPCARPHQNPRLASQSRKSDQKNTHYI